jgi:hypothetical protein
MQEKRIHIWYYLFLMAGIGFYGMSAGYAEPAKDMRGWEAGSPYNTKYDPAEMDSFKGRVEKIKTVNPMPGMSPGVVLHVRESEDEVIVVHVCPEWYMGVNELGIKRGDRVKVNGVWAEIDGNDFFMASKIKKGDHYSLKVRLTKDGTPFWTMDPETLAREKKATDSQ